MKKKDMELKYRVLDHFCIDECPFGEKGEFNNNIIKIGSASCGHCKNFNGEPKEFGILYCQKQGELKEREAKND
jgi:hypothetical protein